MYIVKISIVVINKIILYKRDLVPLFVDSSSVGIRISFFIGTSNY